MINSAKFSFVRFEHPEFTDTSLDIPMTLPVFGNHDIGFHFIVGEDRLLTDFIKLGIANTVGVFVSAFDPAAYAVNLSYRYRFAALMQTSIFDLQIITIGQVQKSYNGRIVTPNSLKQILEDDFGVEMIDDYLVFKQIQDVRIHATQGGVPLMPNSGFVSPVWHEGYINVTGVPVLEKDFFSYALLNDNNTVIGYSNTFQVVDEEAYTSLVTYAGKEDAFEFIYAPEGSDNYFAKRANIIRLPLYLNKPDWPTKRTVNRQSNGYSRLISGSVEKQYSLETDHMPEVFHECFRMALSHDEVIIENSNIREKKVEVLESDSYTVNWNDDYKLPYAPGKCTVKVAAFGYANSNC